MLHFCDIAKLLLNYWMSRKTTHFLCISVPVFNNVIKFCDTKKIEQYGDVYGNILTLAHQHENQCLMVTVLEKPQNNLSFSLMVHQILVIRKGRKYVSRSKCSMQTWIQQLF